MDISKLLESIFQWNIIRQLCNMYVQGSTCLAMLLSLRISMCPSQIHYFWTCPLCFTVY